MQKHLVEHRAEHIAIAFLRYCCLNGFGDGAAEAASGVGVFGKNLTANIGGVAGRRGYVGAVGAHHLAAERLLLVGALHHKHLAVEPEI